jgi:hypothetical protein
MPRGTFALMPASAILSAATVSGALGSEPKGPDMLPSGMKKDRRMKKRFAIERDVRYKLLNGQNIADSGVGRTLDMSSTGISFTTEQPLARGTLIELAISWPALLNDNCPMKLMVFGRVVRSGGGTAASTIEKYEFRTSRTHSQPLGNGSSPRF